MIEFLIAGSPQQ